MSADLDLDDVAASHPVALRELAALRAEVARLQHALNNADNNAERDEALLWQALDALEANHKWHQDYDEHGGYPKSELCDTNITAIAALRERLEKP